jgi:hypothetical protein
MKSRDAGNAVRKVAERRASWKAERKFFLLENNPQSRFACPRLMKA